MPKERFHLCLADEFLKKHGKSLSYAFVSDRLSFLIGAVSPDIFYYDFPSFSLSPLGDALHNVMDLEGLSKIGDWIESRVGYERAPERNATASAWAFGLTCHFLLDEVWHPAINELSVSTDYCAAKRLSFIECHRLIESELEALRLVESSRATEECAGLLRDLGKKERVFEIAWLYRELLGFVGLGQVPTAKRIAGCFLSQNFFLRLFANPTLGRLRNRMLDLPLMRYAGSLIVPSKPVLPSLFASALPPDLNPLSDVFMEQAITFLNVRLPVLAKRLL
jgi:hypothetical protein